MFINPGKEIIDEFKKISGDSHFIYKAQEEVVVKAARHVISFINENILPSFIFLHGV